LEERREFQWGRGPIATYFSWKSAHRKAWKSVSRDVALLRLQRAEEIGLTYEEYALELLERGRHLQAEDGELIAAIKAARNRRRRK
jgi:hypothetical protein